MKTTLSVNFTKFNTNKKDETVLEFQVRGDLTDEQILSLHKLKAAGSVTLVIGSSQLDFDDVRPEPLREGLRGTIAGDGTVNLDKGEGQMTIEEATAADEQDNDELPGLEEDGDADLDGDDEGESEEDTDNNDHEDNEHDDAEQSAGEVEASETNDDELPDF